MLGEGAVVDQGGYLGEVGLHALEGGAAVDLTAAVLGRQPLACLRQILRPDGPGAQLSLEGLQGEGEFAGRLGQLEQGVPVVVGAYQLR